MQRDVFDQPLILRAIRAFHDLGREDELVGTEISEMALIDAEGDVIAFSNFLRKGKDETETTFTIEDNY